MTGRRAESGASPVARLRFGWTMAAVLLAAAATAADRLAVRGLSFVARGFAVDALDAEAGWLVDRAAGLELHLVSAPCADAGASPGAAVALWLAGLPEEKGFRLLGASEQTIPGGRLYRRLYGVPDREKGAGTSWRTAAALVLAGDRSVEITLLVPPGSRAAGERAFTDLLASLEVERRH